MWGCDNAYRPTSGESASQGRLRKSGTALSLDNLNLLEIELCQKLAETQDQRKRRLLLKQVTKAGVI